MSCQHPDLQRQIGAGHQRRLGTADSRLRIWPVPPGGFGLLRDSVSPNLGNRSSPPGGTRPYSAQDSCSRLGEEEQGRSPSFFFSPAPLPATHRLGSGVGGGGIRGRAPAGAAAISPSLASLSSRRGSDAGSWQRSCPRRSSCHLDTRLGVGWIRAHAAHTSLQLADRSVPAQATHGAPLAPGHRLSFIPTKTTRESTRVESQAPGPTLGTPGRAPPRSTDAPRCPSAFLSLRHPQTRTPTHLTFAFPLQSASSARRHPAAVPNPARRPGAQLLGRRSASRVAGSACASRPRAWPADPGSRAAD